MTEHGTPGVEVIGVAPDIAAKISGITREALSVLGSAGPTRDVVIDVDSGSAGGVPWFGLQGPREFVLYCGWGDFLEPQPLSSTLTAGSLIWEQHPVRSVVDTAGQDVFSIPIAERFLYHQLVFGGDLLTGAIETALLPVGLNVAFQSAWAVTVDGRLDALALPGYPLYLRRGIFSRLFAGSGILLPDHWQIFQSLWDGGLPAQNDVLGAVRRLPRLIG